MRAITAAVTLSACGRVDFDPLSIRDASSDTSDARAPTTYRDAVIADSPLTYWRLADANTIAVDEVGHEDGRYTGACVHNVGGALAGDNDTSVAFATSCEINVDDPSGALAFTGAAAFTIELWVAPVMLPNYYHLVTRELRVGTGFGSPTDGYAVFIDMAPNGLFGERAVAGAIVKTPPVTLVANRFTHVVAGYDASDWHFFVDGVEVLTFSDPRPMSAFVSSTLIGAHTKGAFLNGGLDEIAIYDHMLDPTRIALHYDIGRNGPR